MKRREFLKQAGCFVVGVGLGGAAACRQGEDDAGILGFPHGVASGDPRPDSVMLWTRVAGSDERVALTVHVSRDEDFGELLVEQALEAGADSDHTVRVLVEGLEPATTYFYRFVAGGTTSRTGRTRTAPAPDADVEVRFAWASCQSYTCGFHSGWRRMINDDMQAPAGEQLDFVLHVGDFIYETREEGRPAFDDDLQPVELVTESGEPRRLSPFPSGEDVGFATTVDDYRHLYKSYLTDPDLQAARARWPFVCIWDDHEFTNDAWQTQANYTRERSTDEPSQRRKVAANQAWFEYIPAALDEAEDAGGVAARAHDFRAADVDNASYDAFVDVDEPNNTAAIETLTVYRRLRFGRHVEIVLTDNRSYRSDHALPEEVTLSDPLVFHPRGGLPLEAVLAFDAGRTANGGNPPDAVAGFDNVRKDSPPGTILGARQKRWFKDAMQASDATFKVWANSVPLLRVLLDSSNVDLIPGDLILGPDAWDGYPTERNELMAFLRDNGVRNVISLSGDHHAHLAGLVMDDHEVADPTPVMVDFAVAGMSSTSQVAAIANAVQSAAGEELADVVAPVVALITFDATELGGSAKAVPNMNTLIRWGSAAAAVAADTFDTEMAEAMRDPAINPHLRYADTAARGYGLARIGPDDAQITFITIPAPVEDRGEAGSDIRARATFTVPRVDDANALDFDEPRIEGDKPFPLA